MANTSSAKKKNKVKKKKSRTVENSKKIDDKVGKIVTLSQFFKFLTFKKEKLNLNYVPM